MCITHRALASASRAHHSSEPEPELVRYHWSFKHLRDDSWHAFGLALNIGYTLGTLAVWAG